MNFNEAESYLLSLGNEVSAMKLGLESIRTILSELGEPQTRYLKVQVAGTNGKGSVCAFLNSISLSASIRTGMFTSPHLISITERIQINGVSIGEDEFARYATHVRSVAEELVAKGRLDSIPTFFEQVTAIALLAFADATVELAILETGLGGRLDATTAAGAELAVITRIDLDHQQYLGATIEEIAAEKAAIIRKDSTVVIGQQQPKALQAILDRCRQLNVIPHAVNKHSRNVGVTPGLKGRHQVENAYTAVMTAAALANDLGLEISDEHVRRGIESAHHPGRLEFRGRYLFDGAHNVGGARALREYLDEHIDSPITMIFGAMRDKNVDEIAKILFPVASTLVLTRPNNERATEADELKTLAGKYLAGETMIAASSVREAIDQAEGASGPDRVILVTGSLYLVGEVQRVLYKKLKFEI